MYPPTVILRCFVVRIWLRLDSNRALHEFLAMDYYPYNRKIMKACGLTSLPDRRTFDRRLSTISVAVELDLFSYQNQVLLFVHRFRHYTELRCIGISFSIIRLLQPEVEK